MRDSQKCIIKLIFFIFLISVLWSPAAIVKFNQVIELEKDLYPTHTPYAQEYIQQAQEIIKEQEDKQIQAQKEAEEERKRKQKELAKRAEEERFRIHHWRGRCAVYIYLARGKLKPRGDCLAGRKDIFSFSRRCSWGHWQRVLRLHRVFRAREIKVCRNL